MIKKYHCNFFNNWKRRKLGFKELLANYGKTLSLGLTFSADLRQEGCYRKGLAGEGESGYREHKE